MNHEQITQINKDQYADELDRKEWMYDAVKSTVKLCEVMAEALDPTSENEKTARLSLISYLQLARQYALLCATDVGAENRGLGK